MSPEELRSARRKNDWSQHQAASRMGVSQSYLAMMETGKRVVPPWLVRKVSALYSLPPTSLPLPDSLEVKSQEDTLQYLAEELAALGYEGFAHLHCRAPLENPAWVLLSALAQRERLEARLVEALPWVLVRYTTVDGNWLLHQAKHHDLQNHLGFVTTLAREVVERQTPQDEGRVKALCALEEALEDSKLAKVEPLCNASVGAAEKQWLQDNSSEEGRRWHLLTDWKPEMLRYASA